MFQNSPQSIGNAQFSQLASAVASSTPSPNDQKAYLTALSGDKFKETPRFFHNHSQIVWDGQPISGSDDIKQFWNMLSSTQHDVRVCDSQPILVPQINELKNVNSPSLLVTVSGNVKYGVRPTQHSFHHVFVLERDLFVPSNQGEFYYIVSATIRTQRLTAAKQAALASATASGLGNGVSVQAIGSKGRGGGGGGGFFKGGRGGGGRGRRMSR